MEIRPVGVTLIYASRWMDMIELIDASREIENLPEYEAQLRLFQHSILS